MTKWQIVLLIALLLVSSFVLISCSEKKEKENNGGGITDPGDLTPDKVDFAVYVYYGNEEDEEWDREENHLVIINKINKDAVVSDLKLKINGELVMNLGMMPIGNSWYVAYELEQGRNYTFELSTSAKTYTGALKTVYAPSSVTFPKGYTAEKSGLFEWTLSHNNQMQIFEAESELYDTDKPKSSEFFKELNPSDRKYTMPANTLRHFGDGTRYWFSLTQMNSVTSGKLFICSICSNEYMDDWFFEEWGVNRSERLVERCIQLTEEALN